MGRPTLNMKSTVVRLPAQTIARINEIAGQYGMAKFIREAVMRELKEREKEREKACEQEGEK